MELHGECSKQKKKQVEKSIQNLQRRNVELQIKMIVAAGSPLLEGWGHQTELELHSTPAVSFHE